LRGRSPVEGESEWGRFLVVDVVVVVGKGGRVAWGSIVGRMVVSEGVGVFSLIGGLYLVGGLVLIGDFGFTGSFGFTGTCGFRAGFPFGFP
jgi:hypothetical protein